VVFQASPRRTDSCNLFQAEPRGPKDKVRIATWNSPFLIRDEIGLLSEIARMSMRTPMRLSRSWTYAAEATSAAVPRTNA